MNQLLIENQLSQILLESPEIEAIIQYIGNPLSSNADERIRQVLIDFGIPLVPRDNNWQNYLDTIKKHLHSLSLEDIYTLADELIDSIDDGPPFFRMFSNP